MSENTEDEHTENHRLWSQNHGWLPGVKTYENNDKKVWSTMASRMLGTIVFYRPIKWTTAEGISRFVEVRCRACNNVGGTWDEEQFHENNRFLIRRCDECYSADEQKERDRKAKLRVEKIEYNSRQAVRYEIALENKKMDEIFHGVLNNEFTICESCDNTFDYKPQKRFCGSCR